jgi:hypothetical protein
MQRQLHFNGGRALDRTALLRAAAVDALDAVGADKPDAVQVLADDRWAPSSCVAPAAWLRAAGADGYGRSIRRVGRGG